MNGTTVHLRGLPRASSVADGVREVMEVCSPYGVIEQCFLIKRRGQALVSLRNAEEAQMLLRAKLIVRNKVIATALSTRTSPLFTPDRSSTGNGISGGSTPIGSDGDSTDEIKHSIPSPFVDVAKSLCEPVYSVWPCVVRPGLGDCVVVKIEKKYHLAIVQSVHSSTLDLFLSSGLSTPDSGPCCPVPFPSACSSPFISVNPCAVIPWARPHIFPPLPVPSPVSSEVPTASPITIHVSSNLPPSSLSSPLLCPVWVCRETSQYHFLAKTQVHCQDVALEIGCDFGACCALLSARCRIVLGVDKEDAHVKIAQQRVPNAHFKALDVLFDPGAFARWIRELERNGGARVNVVFIDINGNRGLQAVRQVLLWVLQELCPELVVVKSRALASECEKRT